MEYICDYAKSNQSVCRGCSVPIRKATTRFGKYGQCRTADMLIPNWYHSQCFFLEHVPASTSEIEGFHLLKWEHQQEAEQIIDKGVSPFASEEGKKQVKRAISLASSKASVNEYLLDCTKTTVKCTSCVVKIKKGEIRVSKNSAKPKLRNHLTCFSKNRNLLEFFECGNLIPGFNTLSKEQQGAVVLELSAINDEPPEKKRLSNEVSKPTSSQEKPLNKQDNIIMHQYRNDLKLNLKKDEIAWILKHNCQSVPTGIDNILDRASDMMTYGALERCRKCKRGQLAYTNGGYKCLSVGAGSWLKCSAIIASPRRASVEIPTDLRLRHTCLYKYEFVARERTVLKPRCEIRKDGPLKNSTIVLAGFEDAASSVLKIKVRNLGGRVLTDVYRSVLAVVSTLDEIRKNTKIIQLSKCFKVYVVSTQFLDEIADKESHEVDALAKKHSMVDWGREVYNRVPDQFDKLKTRYPKNNNRREEEKDGKRRMRVKRGIAIEPSSGLEDVAHVYTSGGTVFNAVLSLADVQENKNSFYKLQLLESDVGEEYWVFRSWGRTGTEVGGCNCNKMESLLAAKNEFKDCFKEKTGNKWENRFSTLNRSRGYTLIDVSYDAKTEEIQDLGSFIPESQLKLAVAELISIIFSVQSMNNLMLEYELNMEKMPLGKLSRSHIMKAYNILTQATYAVQNKQKGLLTCLTNEFYTYMPSNVALARPPPLDNLDIINKKSAMLANLLEMETAYAIIQRGAECQGGNMLDAFYRELNADIHTILEDSDEYRMISEYVTNTHADTHRHYNLKILEAFRVCRQGEDERYQKHKNLHNRRLLWHGSRVTNYAGIISQGLRIAPPEAPMTGYMFGKGIYFADIISKSANYCCTTQQDRTGLVLLCEVALGSMVEKFKAEDCRKQINTRVDSVRGVGQTAPDPRATRVLSDGVQVPLGKLVVDLDIQSHLLYNEYIVYDPSQVKIKYLLKMDFQYKTQA